MAIVDSAGVTPTTLPEYIGNLQNRYRTALSNVLDLSDETPQGQLIGIEAEALTIIDEMLVSASNGMAIETASGIQLDDYGTLLGVERKPGSYSSCRIRFDDTVSFLAYGHRFQAGGKIWRTKQVYTNLNASSIVDLICDEVGAIDSSGIQLRDSIEENVTIVIISQVLGNDSESDNALRNRYHAMLAKATTGTLEAIRAAVLAVPGVKRCLVRDNSTDAKETIYGTINGIDYNTDARGIDVWYLGGTGIGVETAVALAKPAGAPVRVGNNILETDVNISVSIQVGGNFPGDGVDQIKKAVVGLVDNSNECFAGSTVFGIGQIIDEKRVEAAVLSIPGVTLNSLTMTALDVSDGNTKDVSLLPLCPARVWLTEENKVLVFVQQ